MGEVIAMLSGKGGTGKSSLCAGIATALAQSGSSVLCIDCDAGLPSLDIFLGLSHTAPLSFQDDLSGKALSAALPPHPRFPKLHFLTAPVNRSIEQVDTQRFFDLLGRAKQQFDFVLLDGAAGIGAGFRLASEQADRIAVVTGIDTASVRAAARIGQALELMGKRDVRLIVNRVDAKALAAMDLTVDDLMDKAGLPLLGIVPTDPEMALAAFGDPQFKQNKKGALAACCRIAARLQGKAQTIPSKLI